MDDVNYSGDDFEQVPACTEEQPQQPKRGRGRPRKNATAVQTKTTRPRGRPRKQQQNETPREKRPVGRPRKFATNAERKAAYRARQVTEKERLKQQVLKQEAQARKAEEAAKEHSLQLAKKERQRQKPTAKRSLQLAKNRELQRQRQNEIAARRQARGAEVVARRRECEEQAELRRVQYVAATQLYQQKEFLDNPLDRKKEPASSCTHGKSTKPVQTEASWLFNSSVDVAVETPRSIHVCKSTQASLVAVKVHRWTETTDLVERKDSETYVQEFPAPHVRGMPRLTNLDQSPGVSTLYSHQVDGDRKKKPASCCTHGKSTKPVQTEASWLFNSSVDVAVETSRSIDMCKSTQASLVAVKVHRWTETRDLVESKDSDTHVQEIPAPHVRGMPRLTNMDQSPRVATLYSSQVDGVKLPTLGTCGSHRLSQDRLGYEEIRSSPPAALVRSLPSQHRQSSLG
ncbi:hypothetical protein HPB49_022674 [Dermacentor silvarum]|uniref:Uncharacterized protein n=1 Tax=Dermacentor silvarum TaxID=543639 RepID=A0ACB8CHR2_DERSI|nr:hypothetical protein HPB49_022674 [Dermacentor silvarum]